MTQDRYLLWIDDYVDGLLAPEDLQGFELHLESCGTCQHALAEARALADLAGELPESVAPSRDLWQDIDARIAPKPVTRLPWARLALAAVVLIATTAGLTSWLVQPPETVAAAEAPVEAPSMPLAATEWEAQMQEATTALSEALEARRGELDPEAVRIVEENLVLIDRAIRECHEALGTDPENPRVKAALLATWQRKVDLLELATRMPRAS